MAQNDLISEAELLEAHQSAIKQQRVSQHLAVAVPLILVIGLVIALWIKLDQFRKEGLPQTVGLLIEHAPESLTPVSLEASKALQRLAPVYASAISQMAQRDKDKINAIADAQIKAFKAYSLVTQQIITDKMQAAITDTAYKVTDQLSASMTADQAQRFHDALASALYTKLESQIQNRWSSHLDLVGQVAGSLYSIALTTPEAKGTAPSVVLGAGMELMGRKIQGIQ